MASFRITDISIKGIAAAVPANISYNRSNPDVSKEDMEKFIEATGVEQRRIAPEHMCTSDLCQAAAEKLLVDVGWEKKDIEILVFVSQTADYLLPVTSALLQHKLGLSKNCIAFDIPLGCSGYVYGLSIISSMMKTAGLKKGLLLAGDTSSQMVSPKDKSAKPLFGDGGSATCLSLDEFAEPMFFDLGTDGSGSNAIIVPHGGCRNRITEASFTYEVIEEGIERNQTHLVLDGMDVFSFGISQAPKTVNALVEQWGIDKEKVDYFVFHQANQMMNKMIAKKLKLPGTKVPYSLQHFGNTSSATIPLTIVSQLREAVTEGKKSFVFCGFGVGLSWGTAYVSTTNLVVSALIEL
jgi:3-oxoacyl-[acyl-carrier-protein] synthase III